MGQPRCRWWGYKKRVLREYPDFKNAGSHDRQTQREIEAVEKALSEVDDISKKLVELVFWKRTCDLEGAAQYLFISYRTARRRQEWVIVSVAENLGLTEKVDHKRLRPEV